jgi:ATP-dependent RNA/DNA helicase IGHMBP2
MGGPAKAPPPHPPLTPEAWAEKTLKLLTLERDSEVDAARAALSASASTSTSTRSLAPLRVSDTESGLLGRTLLRLVYARGGGPNGTAQQPLPPHSFSPHDLVELRPAKAPPSDPPAASGVVYRVTDDVLTVALDEPPDDDEGGGLGGSLRAVRLANEVTHARLAATVTTLAGGPAGAGAAAPLVDVLFGTRPPLFDERAMPSLLADAGGDGSDEGGPPPPSTSGKWFNPRLDATQRSAVATALAARDVALIHGPPGTGKTTAVVELVRQAVARGDRVLVAAASNVAVDTLTERLATADPALRVLRVGHPARLLPSVLACSLDARVGEHDQAGLAADCARDMRKATARLLKLGPRERAARRELRAEVRVLAKEQRARQAKAVASVLAAAPVVAATLTGVPSRTLAGQTFDLAVVDEAAQALEAAAWAALLRSRVAVLVGDHRQLPPTITSPAAASGGLDTTLFERAHGLFSGGGELSRGDKAKKKKEDSEKSTTPPGCEPRAVAMLTTQYRMHAAICGWASREQYGGRLVPAASVAGHTLADLLAERGQEREAEAVAGDDAFGPLLFIDTAGCGCDEAVGSGEGASSPDASIRNDGEAAAAWAHVRRLVISAGLRPGDVGVISPYAAQVAALRELRAAEAARSGVSGSGGAGAPAPIPWDALEISTVDGFQGREKEAIVISAVRSNDAHTVGFLADARRMNVAVTRGRRHVALVGDSETLGGGDAFLKRMVAWFEENGAYDSADAVLAAGEAEL